MTLSEGVKQDAVYKPYMLEGATLPCLVDASV